MDDNPNDPGFFLEQSANRNNKVSTTKNNSNIIYAGLILTGIRINLVTCISEKRGVGNHDERTNGIRKSRRSNI